MEKSYKKYQGIKIPPHPILREIIKARLDLLDVKKYKLYI